MYFDGITVFVEEDDGSWTQYDYEGTLYTDEGFSDEVKAFLKASLKYYEKQQMLEEMYKLDYFSRRPIFGSVAKDGFLRSAPSSSCLAPPGNPATTCTASCP